MDRTNQRAVVHPFYYRHNFICFPLGDYYPKNWDKSTTTAAECQKLIDQSNGAYYRYGVIIPPDWIVADSDPRNDGHVSVEKMKLDYFCDLEALSGFTVSTGRDGRHYYFKGFPESKRSKKTHEAVPGIDFIRSGRGQMFVVGAGSLPKPGQAKPYEVVADRPELLDSGVPGGILAIIPYDPPKKSRREEDDALSLMKARRAMAAMPGEKAEDYDSWVRIGLACKEVDSEEMLAPWIEWSSKAKSFESDAKCIEKWENDLVPSGEAGVGTLIHEAGDAYRKMSISEAAKAFEEAEKRDPRPQEAAKPQQKRVSAVPRAGTVAGPRDSLWNSDTTGEGKNKVTVGRTLSMLLNDVLPAFDLMACGGYLVAPEGTDVNVMTCADEFFAWLHRYLHVNWRNGGGCVTKNEFFRAVVSHAPKINSISATPHFPPLEKVHYRHQIPVGDDSDLQYFLQSFIGQFHPETEIDRSLLIAAFVTPFWGGPFGSRPIFVITSPDGVAAGKSTICQWVARLLTLGEGGGSIQIRKKKEFEDLPVKLGSLNPLSPQTIRSMVIDNYSGHALGGSDIEAMLTEPYLSVRRLYHGEVTLANSLTWYCTGNYIELSEDLASRSAPLSILAPNPWQRRMWEPTMAAIDLTRVIRGIGAWLQQEVTPPTVGFRFATWAEQVIGRLPDPDLILETILQRSKKMDTNLHEALVFRESLEAFLASGYELPPAPKSQPGATVVPTNALQQFFHAAGHTDPYGHRWNSKSLGHALRKYGKHLNLEPYRTNQFRAWLWFRDEK